MLTVTTEGVQVGVETSFQREFNKNNQSEFVFAYRITIHNEGSYAVQLMRRHWYVFDSCGVNREVEGAGVVGEQPVIEPGQSYSYVSGCHLHTDIGAMHGIYQMKRLIDGKIFDAKIPRFTLVAPFKLN